jgi:DNA-directed RNA polymerase specialized sigma24 family protein
MWPMKMSPHPDINWDSLARRVLGIALSLFRKQGLFYPHSVLKGLGFSAGDLAQEAMREFLTHRDRYEAKTEDQCLAIIAQIMKNDFLDAVTRKHAYIKTDNIEAEELTEKNKGVAASDDGLKNTRVQELAGSFQSYAGDDPELRDIIEAAAVLAEEQTDFKREDIANLLGISPGEVTKRTSRLKYNFNKIKSRADAQTGK